MKNRRSGEKNKGSCTSAGGCVALSPSIARVTPRKGKILQTTMKHEGRITRVWVGLQEIMNVYAMYCWHSEGMSTSTEELLETMWKSMIEVRYSRTIERDANIQPEVIL